MLDPTKSRGWRALLNPLNVAIVVCGVAGAITYALTHRLESGLVLGVQKAVCLTTGAFCVIEAPFEAKVDRLSAISLVGRRVFVRGIAAHSVHPPCRPGREAISGGPSENQRHQWPSQQVRTAATYLAVKLRASGAEVVEELERAELIVVGYVSKVLPPPSLPQYRGGGQVHVWAEFSMSAVSNGCPIRTPYLRAHYECRYPLASPSACVPAFLDDMFARLGGAVRPLAFKHQIDLRS